MNDHLTEYLVVFLQSYLDWAMLGAPDTQEGNPHKFDRSVALCDNLGRYLHRNLRNNVISLMEATHIDVGMGKLFRADGLDDCYPFGMADFQRDYANKTHHTNVARLTWVRKQLVTLSGESRQANFKWR